MQPEIALKEPAEFAGGVPRHWRAPLLQLALAWAGLFLLTWRDWTAMAGQWWDSSTFNHILLVPPILFWLVKLRAPQLAEIQPRGWWPGLAVLAGAAFLWLLGTITGLNLASQLGAVVMLQAAVLTLLGPRIAAGLLFPLVYMLFLVPFGDIFVPQLQMITAELTIWLTRLSGVPAVIDGVFIDTPAGLFEVAEECSGVKFLIAMVALATLVAHTCFLSWWRRAAFLAVAVALPILANGVRAWGTVFIAQSQGVEFAAGFDHIFYGWVFFALVMAALLVGGWPFFDRPAESDFVDVEALRRSRLLAWLERFSAQGWAALAGIALVAGGMSAWTAAARQLEADLPGTIVLPEVPGWQLVDYRPLHWWEPRATGADHRLLGRYRDRTGREVDVFYALYSAQEDGREAGGFGEGALMPETAWRWLAPATLDDGSGADWLQAEGYLRRLATTWYRSGDTFTGSNAQLKIANMVDRLAMRARPTAMLILSAEAREDLPTPLQPQAALEAFIRDAGPLPRWMDRIAQTP